MKNRIVLMCALLLSPVVAHATVTGTATSASFVCTGSTGPFPFTFPIDTAAAMTVTQNGTVLASSAYTISPVNNSYANGGSVTLNTACPAAQILVLQRVTPITQLTQFTPYMPVMYANIESGLDKVTEIEQELVLGVSGGITQLTGDVLAGPGTGSANATLKVVNSSPGNCGDSSHTCAITTDSNGRVTSQSPIAINTSSGISGMTAGQIPIAATASTITSSKVLSGTGAGITTGPTTTTLNDCVKFGDTAGTLADAGAACGSGGGSYLPLSGGTLTGALTGTSASFSGTVSAGSETLGSPLLPASGGTGATTAAGALANLGAVGTSTTVNGHALSSNVTVSASDLTTGTLPHAQLPVLVSGDIPSNAANTTGTAAGFTGSLAGDVTGTQSATTVGKVNGAAVPASKSVVGTNSSGQIIDATSWAENLLGAALYPGYQALYLPYMDGSGTVLHDQSGNHYDMTFASGGNAPTWSADGSIIFTPTNTIAGGQWLSGPAAVLAGAGTIQMWYEQIMPYSIDGLSHSIYKQWAIGDSSGNGLGWYPAYFGAPAMIGNPTLYNYDLIPTDRLIGNSSFTVVCNGASPATAYVNGHSPTSYLYPAVTSTLPSCPTWASTGSVEIGGTSYFSGVGNSTPQWKLFGIVVYPTTVPVTPAIVLQNEAFMSKTALPQHGATTFGIESRPPYWLAYQGDSRMANAAGSPPSGGNWQLTTSREWQISRLEPDRDQYNDMGMYNQRLSTMVTNMPNEITPLCTQNISVAKTVLLDAGTNDIQGGATGATTYASLQSYASNLHTACNGVKILYATSVARGSFTATMEGYRETLNSDAISGWVAGTFNGDAVDDNANDPIAATQVTPNTYNPSAASSCNATWFDSDCVHFTAAMNAEMASGESAAIKLVQGRLNTCTIVQKQIPYQVLVAANTASPGLTQTIPLGIQLAKGENVCSLSENITSAFTGPTTLTMSVGNSGGSTTSYQSAFSLMSGGDTTASPTYVGPGGAVNVTFTATGANLSTVSGGNMVVNVGVIYNGLY